MNILLKSAFVAVVCMPMVSCQKELPKVVTPATTKIEGNLGKHFVLVDKEYKFPDFDNALKVELKRVTSEYEYSSTEAGIGYEFFDESGNVIVSEKAVLEPITPIEWGSVFPTKEGETTTKYVYLKGWPEAYRGAKSFKLILDCNEVEDSDN